MKIYIVQYLGDPADDMSFAGINGVFKTLEEAQKCMTDNFETSKTEHEITEGEIKSFDVKLYEDDMTCSICHYGNYYEWNIYEFEI